jgi:hypothetical protein
VIATSRSSGSARLEGVGQRTECLQMELLDVGVVVYFPRKVIWMVPATPSRATGAASPAHRTSKPERHF